ncbi:MAG: cell division protein FtsA [Hyphomicrobium sp.]|jgi:cell division protein FtsA|nr:cell division protein FtsA [Hyphomicrobium sp.]
MSSALRPGRSGRFAAVLDAGSFKTVCLIASCDPEGRPARIIGVGLVPSRGVRAGTIVDLAAAEGAIRCAIAQAEMMAGISLDMIDLHMNGGHLASRTFAVSAPTSEGVITHHTVKRVESIGRSHGAPSGRSLLQLENLGFRADAGALLTDPIGIAARRLTLNLHAVSADTAAVVNLTRTVERSFLAPRRIVPGPVASALAVCSEDERRHGVIVIDIGAEVTGTTVFASGRSVFTGSISMGGAHVTHDLVHALRTPLEEAERIKTVYGTVLKAQSDQHDIVTYAISAEGEGFEQRSTKADLARIIQSRMAHLLILVRDQLANAGLLERNAARIVLCGGGSEITGLQSFAEGVLGRPVRLGRPRPISGLPPLYASAAFAGGVGVLRAVAESAVDDLNEAGGVDSQQSYFVQVGQWLKDGF